MVIPIGTDARRATHERIREQIRTAQRYTSFLISDINCLSQCRSHRQRKQLHLKSMQQSLDQLAKEIATLKRELENSRTENWLLQARLSLHLPLLPGKLPDAPLSPPSSLPSMMSAGSPDSLTYTKTHPRQGGTGFLHSEQPGQSNKEINYHSSVVRSPPSVSEQGAHPLQP